MYDYASGEGPVFSSSNTMQMSSIFLNREFFFCKIALYISVDILVFISDTRIEIIISDMLGTGNCNGATLY